MVALCSFTVGIIAIIVFIGLLGSIRMKKFTWNNICIYKEMRSTDYYQYRYYIYLLLVVVLIVYICNMVWLKELVGNVSTKDYISGIHSFEVEIEFANKKYVGDGELVFYSDEDYEEIEDYTGNTHTKVNYNTSIYLNKVYSKNGKYINFENDDSENEIIPEVPMKLEDVQGNTFICTLIDKHVDSKYIIEDKKLSFSSVIMNIIIIALYVCYIVGCYIIDNEMLKKINDNSIKKTNTEDDYI